MKDVSADDSADGFDNTSLKNKNKNRIVLQNLRVKRKDQSTLARNASVWLKQ